MSPPQARPPHRDIRGVFVHDDKDELDVVLTDDATLHDHPHPTYRHSTPDLEIESDLEGTTAHVPPETHLVAPNRTVSSKNCHDASRLLRVDHLQVQSDEPILTGLGDRTGPRVRFRSRVRIAGGMGRRRRRSNGPSSNASSISGSPSSSISAPLRTHYTGNNGWVPLGGRVKLVASQAALTPPPCRDHDDVNGAKGNSSGNEDGYGYGYRNAQKRRAPYSWTFQDDDTDEYTHLLTSGTGHSYVGRHAHDGYHDDEEWELERRWREHLVDETFGKWPGRLLNRHWWWWHLEPIVCCFCLCEPDEEF